jgi:succinate-acetate transporter protein
MAALNPTHDEPIKLVHTTEATVTGPLAGDPALLGLPSFIVGSVALALTQIGLVPLGMTGSALPIVLAATAIGMFIATFWAAAIGQSAVAGVYGIFGGFYLSLGVMVLGLTHNWFGVTPAAIADTQKLFFISWLVVIVLLTLASIRLPVMFTALFALVDVALFLVLFSVIQNSTSLMKAGGYVVLAFSALGAYLFFGAVWHATGGKELPAGKPIVHA